MSAPAPEQPEPLPPIARLAMPLERARRVYDLLIQNAALIEERTGGVDRDLRLASDDFWEAVIGAPRAGIRIGVGETVTVVGSQGMRIDVQEALARIEALSGLMMNELCAAEADEDEPLGAHAREIHYTARRVLGYPLT